MPDHGWLADTRTSYDTVAESYADMLRDGIAEHPYVRHVLALFADLVKEAGGGPVADVGCGPGWNTAFLRDLGLEPFGIDLSPAMIDIARRNHPDLRFEVGSMTELDLAESSVTGILAFYSVIHVPDEGVLATFAHFRRALRPGGVVLVGFHVGDGTHVKTQGYGGHPMRIAIHRRPIERVAGWLADAGLRVEARIAHDPDETARGGMVFARG